MCASRYEHLVVSDLHIGGGGHDAELVDFLTWHSEHPPDDRAWRLVIAGDGIDFLHASLGEDEHTEARAITTLEAIVQRHRSTFAALAAFVGRGHELVFVGGNHDAELHWDGVRARLRGLLLELYVERLKGRTADVAMIHAFSARVRFCPWFFLEPGALYIEHGHQYDELCSFEHVLYPVGPDERIEAPLSHVTLRKFKDLVHRLDLSRVEYWGLGDYLKWAASLPRRPLFESAVTYLSSPQWLVGLARRLVRPRGEVGRIVRDRSAAIVEEFGVDDATLARLDANRRAPAGRRWTSGLTMLFYDQMALFGLSLALLTGCIVTPVSGAMRMVIGLALLFATWWSSRHLARRRSVAAHDKLVAGAAAAAQIVDAKYVVFGHTHVPIVEAVAEGTSYVNTGSWTHDAGRTFFRLTRQDAALCRWSRELGRPVRIESADAHQSPRRCGNTSSIRSSACAAVSPSAITSSFPDFSSGPTL